jgi:hypothetical protein
MGSDGYRPARRACVVTALRPAHPHRPGRRRSHVTVTRHTVPRRTVRRLATAPPLGGGVVFVVAGGDMVAVFDNPEAAGIMAVTMTGTNLAPLTVRLTPAQWDEARAVLRAHLPRITITDARSGRVAGAS